MTISDFSVHNVLRTYNKQYRIGKLVKGVASKGNPKNSVNDAVEISIDSKKISFVKNVSHEVSVALRGRVSDEEIERKVENELNPYLNDLAKEFSPDDNDVIEIIKDKMLEIF